MRVAVLCPIGGNHVSLAVTTARAGGLGIVDLVHGRAASCTSDHVRTLTDAAGTGRPRIGLRERMTRALAPGSPIAALAGFPHIVILAALDWSALPAVLASLQHPGREIWLETGSPAEIDAASPDLAFAGWVGAGAESGGLCGEVSTFVLAQHLARQPRPFMLRGGIGVHSASACRAAGAAGVVFDDAVLLLPESPLSPVQRHLLSRVGVSSTAVVRRGPRDTVRVIDRPDAPGGATIRARADEIAGGGIDPDTAWRTALMEIVGWGDAATSAWPVGEGVALAPGVAASFRSVAALVHHVESATAADLRDAVTARTLSPGAPLAASHGTATPIVQGPMTRVSDRVSFARAVADAGALPLLALALARGPEAAALLDEAADVLGGRPWGLGILGFVPETLRDEQLREVTRVRPPFVLVSGGRPDQAVALEALGIATYLHAPAPLLPPFVAAGVRRFVFEGGECGGHVGPLHSFTLWDYAVSTLLTSLTRQDAGDAHVLLAGGIHDAHSAAMAAALTAALVRNGIKVGVLMGTAYLFTEEAVACGAIVERFQRQAIESRRTTIIETGPGHVIRCAETPFTEAFARERAALESQGLRGAAINEALEGLIVGRSRIASKGRTRRDGTLVDVDEQYQHEHGMYMLGEVAALRHEVCTLQELHETIANGSHAVLATAAASLPPQPVTVAATPKPADVAIVGIACVAPGASDHDTFWRHLLDRTPAIREIPPERWDWRLLYDPDPAARDRIYSKWGGFIDPLPFNPVAFGIPPRSVRAITLPQLIALELTQRALRDAGFGDTIADAALRERTAIIFGTGSTADIEQLYMTRAALPLVVPQPDDEMLARLPEWTEESYPGLLANVVAGRVANRFDLRGPNLTVDAACASSLAALDVAVRELTEGRSDLVIAGGIEFEQSPQAYMGFSRTRALSPDGQARVFDKDANGIVISEGATMLVLRRLADAERSGDRIYAVIKAVAGSSDGRGLSLTAPKPGGQQLALDRAYAAAGVSPASVGMYEAHGTGTAVGDTAEAESISALLRRHEAAPHSCAIGSLKSLLGHTRCAAGMLSMAKAALALYHRTLPPHAGITTPLPALAGDDTPLAVYDAPRPWLGNGGPARASVSAFGFGGTNFHAVLEAPSSAMPAPYGASRWPAELFLFSAADRPAAVKTLDRLMRGGEYLVDAVRLHVRAPFSLADLACTATVASGHARHVRVAIVATTAQELVTRCQAARAALLDGAKPGPGVHVGEGAPEGSLGILFPGQGSQAPGMGRDIAVYVPEVRDAVERASHWSTTHGARLDEMMWPATAFDEDARQRQRRAIADTRVAQPALGALEAGLFAFLTRLGVRPARLAGHSYGEFVALHAAGCFSQDALFRVSSARGDAMASLALPGTMAAIGLSASDVASLIASSPLVRIANINAPSQVVISGPTADVEAVCDRARAHEAACTMLPVSGAFHSPLMVPAREALASALRAETVAPPTIPVHANLDGKPYPSAPEQIVARLDRHLEDPVDFVAQVRAMHAAGVRTFLEAGAGRVLTSLAGRTLAGEPHAALSMDGDLTDCLTALARLYALGHLDQPAALFDRRQVRVVDLDALTPPAAPSWYLDGGRAWPADAPRLPAGREAFLTLETARTAVRPTTATMPEVPRPLFGATPAEQTVLQAYGEYERTMRQFLDQQERLLQTVLGQVQGSVIPVGHDRAAPPATPGFEAAAPGSAVPASPPERGRSTSSEAPRDTRSVAERLLLTVANLTGYSEDALGLDLDLEADLGIDSIRRLEILSALVRDLDRGPLLQPKFDRLARLRTLREIIDLIQITLAAPSSDPTTVRKDARVPRFVTRLQPAPHLAADEPLAGLQVIVDDGSGLAGKVANGLRERGGGTAIVDWQTAASREALVERLATIRAAHGPVSGVVLLAVAADVAGVAAHVTLKVLQACAHDLAEASKHTQPCVLTVTGMDGSGGRTRAGLRTALAGGCHGVLRTFEAEYPDVRAVVLDIDPLEDASSHADVIVREFASRDQAREVGCSGATRSIASTVDAGDTANSTTTLVPSAGWVVFATGGAQGITAAIVESLVVPGVHFVLCGRRPDHQVDRGLIERLVAAGASVEYHAVDVRDAEAFGRTIDGTYARHGRIDAVLHGAGVIEDQWFDRKTDAAFARVFSTKVDSALTLARHLRGDSLRWCALFGSVSGRFGNPGQADYAAANEVLRCIAWALSREWPRCRTFVIDWGPWRGTGMVSQTAAVMLEARGIESIATDEGCRLFASELRRTPGDVEVIVGRGPWSGSVEQGAEPQSGGAGAVLGADRAS